MSAIACLPEITRPSELDGKTYASYNAKYETAIVQAMVKNDGGLGVFTEIHPAKLDCFEALKRGEAQATWVFKGHEGVEADLTGAPRALSMFAMADFGVPYGYSPLLLTTPLLLGDPRRAAHVRAFLDASARGFAWAASHPVEAADLLAAQSKHPTLADPAFVRASQSVVGDAYLDSRGEWGRMDPAVWADFLGFVDKLGVGEVPDADTLFTNAFLDEK
jgi:NitT/TauT family transport system substrate-binding protein